MPWLVDFAKHSTSGWQAAYVRQIRERCERRPSPGSNDATRGLLWRRVARVKIPTRRISREGQIHIPQRAFSSIELLAVSLVYKSPSPSSIPARNSHGDYDYADRSRTPVECNPNVCVKSHRETSASRSALPVQPRIYARASDATVARESTHLFELTLLYGSCEILPLTGELYATVKRTPSARLLFHH